MFRHSLSIFALVLISVSIHNCQYTPPLATVKPLSPSGIRISVPHEEGITLVAFHVKINEDFYALEAGTISVDIIKARNGQWMYEDKVTKLKKGDIIYYWVHVVYNGLGYNLSDQKHVVRDFYNYDGSTADTTSGGSSNIPTCLGSVTKLYDKNGVFTRNPCAGQLLFEDTFRDLNSFNNKQWTVVEKFLTGKEYDFVVYRNSVLNVNILNETLVIKPTLLSYERGDAFIREGRLDLTRCTGALRTNQCTHQAKGWNIIPPVYSGKITTKKILNFEYGRVEIRAKLPRGDWLYPLILLQPYKIIESQSPGPVQLRVASSVGNAQLRTENGVDVSGHILWGGAVGFDSRTASDYLEGSRPSKYNSQLWSESYHTYEMTWSLDNIKLRVDGEDYFEERINNIPKNEPFYLALGVSAGGVTEFPDNVKTGMYSKPWGNTEAKALFHFYNATEIWYKTWDEDARALKVDYVRVYAL